MKIFATSALLCGLLLFAACGGQPDSKTGANDTDPAPAPLPEAPAVTATEVVVLDVSGMT